MSKQWEQCKKPGLRWWQWIKRRKLYNEIRREILDVVIHRINNLEEKLLSPEDLLE
ncbi:hypothetical protein LCGC14_0946730 [marine sediment metagenome]|uniref:Uncharacterized protein n=1 Tax=marine sediment metagenome TaxID=412755 RepID=A0A0F9RPW8_9ZZZZ